MKHNTSNILLKLMGLAIVLASATCGKGEDDAKKKKENAKKTATIEIVGSDISDPTKEFVVKIKNSGDIGVALKGHKLEATIVKVDGSTDASALQNASIKSGASTKLPDTFKVPASAEEEAARVELDLKGCSLTNSVEVKFELKKGNEVVATKTLTWTRTVASPVLTANITTAKFASIKNSTTKSTLIVHLASGQKEFDIKSATVTVTENVAPASGGTTTGITTAVGLRLKSKSTRLTTTPKRFRLFKSVPNNTLQNGKTYTITVVLTLKNSSKKITATLTSFTP